MGQLPSPVSVVTASGLVHRGQGTTAPATSSRTTTWRTSTTASTTRPMAIRRDRSHRSNRRIDGPKYPPSEYLGPAPGVDRLLQQLHDQLPRQSVRDRRQHAQRPGDAEHDDQLRLAAFCNQPALGGPVYWIRNIAYQLPGRVDAVTGGAAGVLFYNNTTLSETIRRRR